MNSFGAKLKRARIQAGLSQEKLADKMGVTPVSVQNWESGKTNVRLSKLNDLSYFFNIPLDTLIKEMLLSCNDDLKDYFPYFLFDDETNDIIKTLHLSLAQQELFGLLYIYRAEYLENYGDYKDEFGLFPDALFEDLQKLPYEFISRFGSIQMLNIAEGLHHVLKYVKTDFLIKVLRLNPEKEFNICTLPKELICDFIDNGHTSVFDDFDWEVNSIPILWFRDVLMYEAQIILPLLEKSPVHLTDNWWSNPLRDDVPDQFREFGENPSQIRSGIECLTNYKEDEEKRWILSINETGEKLLDWFREKES